MTRPALSPTTFSEVILIRGAVPVRDFRDLRVWRRARDLARTVYAMTAQLPAEERYGLSSQMRRAAVSVMANIAEGNGRPYRAEYRRFLAIAIASLRELQSHLTLAQDLCYIDADSAQAAFDISEEVRRMLSTMLGALGASGTPGRRRDLP